MKIYNTLIFRRLLISESVTHFEIGWSKLAPCFVDGYSNRVRTNDGLGPSRDLQSLCSALSRRCRRQGIWLSRSVAGDGICLAHLSRKSARPGVLAALADRAALSDGVSQRYPAQHARRCQRTSRLVHLRGLGTELDTARAQPLRYRTVCARTGANRLRSRCNRHRLVFESFPLGPFSYDQGRDQIAYALGFAGFGSDVSRSDRGEVHEGNLLDKIPIEPGAIYVMDRGYLDFARLARFTQAGAFFVIRAKSNLQSCVRTRRSADPSTGLRCDQSINLRGICSRQDYPDLLRRIRYDAPDHEHTLVFLTNNFTLPALKIAQIYKSRWQIELFFRWIKQHLRIRSFIGTSDNAVRIQIRSAISTYLLVAILKKTLKLEPSLHEILQVLYVTQFEKVPIIELFNRRTALFNIINTTEDIPNLL